MEMPTLTQLQYLIALGKTQHFGRAATECHVSQPSLSAQIQKAEDELGIVIFDRSKQPILVTDQGKLVLEQAKVILKEYEKLLDLQKDTNLVAGEFRLGIIPSLAPYLLPLFLENFSKKYPAVSLTISEHKTEELTLALENDSLDAGIIVTPLNDDRLIERPLFYEPFYLFASNNHPLNQKKLIQESDLDPESVWLLDEGHCFRDQVLRICLSKKRSAMNSNIHFSSGNLETLINLIRRGRGYTLLPYLATTGLKESEKKKNLKAFHKPIPTREVSLVTRRSVHKKQIVDALFQQVIESLPLELKGLKKTQIEVIDI